MNRLSRWIAPLGALTAMSILVPTAAASSPTVMWTSATGYDLAVQGSNWPADDTVGFALAQAGQVYGIELRADSNGSFEIGFKNFSCSQGGTGRARDLSGNTAMPPVMDPCGPNGTPTIPTLTVLVGAPATPQTVSLHGVGNGKVIRVRQGAIIKLWEKGKKNPADVPSAPTKFFFQVGHQRAPAPGCTGTKCPPGFTWSWMATTVGSTAITVRPYCGGGVCPQWAAAIRVKIRPLKT